ncbi:hypothetical protein [uncultured Erythrobacter sp.]|uniref:hypothetical protein n=1 Tax=uncultured Erythrobacter sp. TaxID=263913 RepID=UPI00265A0A1B|nr:hypothetical protein [uncultured Erythrobacter sp.]
MTHHEIEQAIRRNAKKQESGAVELEKPETGNRVAFPVADGPAPEGKKSQKCWI